MPPAAAAGAEAAQQAGALVPDRQGYRSFQLEGAQFLIAQTPEGRLDLRDAYVAPSSGEEDAEAEPAWRRVEGVEGLPAQPQAFQEVPWYTEWGGDVVAEEPGCTWVSGVGRQGAVVGCSRLCLPHDCCYSSLFTNKCSDFTHHTRLVNPF